MDKITRCLLSWKVKSGKEFNNIFSGISFVKLTNESEVHRGFHFEDGLNVDTVLFNPISSCSAGGIYFIEENNIINWVYYDAVVGTMIYVRKVTIPDDARVYIEDDKFKTDKLILGPKSCIDKTIYSHSVESNVCVFKFLSNNVKDKNVCMKAVEGSYTSLNYVPAELRDKNICSHAVKNHGLSLQFVPEHIIDEEMCMNAVKEHAGALQYVPRTLMNKEICVWAVAMNGDLLRFVPYSINDKEICLEAVRNRGCALKYVPPEIIDKNICMVAIMQYHFAIRYV